ncbi:MAG: hypothetical protein AB7I27_13460 [Bacteriovoracaceae bacterium]
MKIFDAFHSALISALELIGKKINKAPPKKKEKTSPLNLNISQAPFLKKQVLRSKEKLGFKGSSYPGKGSVSTATRTFNRPRKDIPVGRRH